MLRRRSPRPRAAVVLTVAAALPVLLKNTAYAFLSLPVSPQRGMSTAMFASPPETTLPIGDDIEEMPSLLFDPPPSATPYLPREPNPTDDVDAPDGAADPGDAADPSALLRLGKRKWLGGGFPPPPLRGLKKINFTAATKIAFAAAATFAVTTTAAVTIHHGRATKKDATSDVSPTKAKL
mmetsp:Transcript_8174/g.16972  ORF Transcript_8174/g.16972 Transcript_8174/m.16972 type:complete len:180 (+) Transcript_8174:28-567(+)